MLPVGVADVPASLQRNPQSAKEPGGHITQGRYIGGITDGQVSGRITAKRHRPDAAAERRHRQKADETGRGNTRKRTHVPQNGGVKPFAFVDRGVVGERQLGPQRQDVFRIESWIGALNRQQRPDQQPGRRKEHDRGRDLGDDQH